MYKIDLRFAAKLGCVLFMGISSIGMVLTWFLDVPIWPCVVLNILVFLTVVIAMARS